jgi:hypothetical protein
LVCSVYPTDSAFIRGRCAVFPVRPLGRPDYDVDEDEVSELVACGPDPERHVEFIQRFADAGYDHVFVHQVGPDQQGFLRFYAREMLPRLDAKAASGVAAAPD